VRSSAISARAGHPVRRPAGAGKPASGHRTVTGRRADRRQPEQAGIFHQWAFMLLVGVWVLWGTYADHTLVSRPYLEHPEALASQAFLVATPWA